MTHDEIARELDGMLTVNQKEKQAVKEAIDIIVSKDWCDPEVELPADTNFVLALISGKGTGVTYDCSPVIAEYWGDEGWYIHIDDDELGYWTVDAWMPIPAYEEAEE